MKATAERLGHTSVRMVDQVCVQTNRDVSGGIADAIDALLKAEE